MKIFLKVVLILVTITCFYVIMTVGIGWFVEFRICKNHDRINQVLLNLSYSYIAGLIFYLFVSYLPFLFLKFKFKSIISNKINLIQKTIESYVQTFKSTEQLNILDNISKEELIELISKNDMYNNSFFANELHYKCNNLKYLSLSIPNIINLINDLLITYKEYLTSKQIIILENIKSSYFINLVKIYEDTPQAKEYNQSDMYKKEVAVELYNIIQLAKKLKSSKKKVNPSMSNYFKYIYTASQNTSEIEELDYYKKFGIEKIDNTYVVKNTSFLHRAYAKSWEIRNYEIDKFWIRAAYFWGFIVMISGGYAGILTSDKANRLTEMKVDLYLLLLGFLFSLSWYLVILGSKRWQENWEKHINMLEDFMSGPLYKTIYYSGKPYYSVSKINEIMALLVVLTWFGLFIRYCKNLEYFNFNNLDFEIMIPITIAIAFSFILSTGYCRKKYNTNKSVFISIGK